MDCEDRHPFDRIVGATNWTRQHLDFFHWVKSTPQGADSVVAGSFSLSEFLLQRNSSIVIEPGDLDLWLRAFGTRENILSFLKAYEEGGGYAISGVAFRDIYPIHHIDRIVELYVHSSPYKTRHNRLPLKVQLIFIIGPRPFPLYKTVMRGFDLDVVMCCLRESRRPREVTFNSRSCRRHAKRGVMVYRIRYQSSPVTMRRRILKYTDRGFVLLGLEADGLRIPVNLPEWLGVG